MIADAEAAAQVARDLADLYAARSKLGQAIGKLESTSNRETRRTAMRLAMDHPGLRTIGTLASMAKQERQGLFLLLGIGNEQQKFAERLLDRIVDRAVTYRAIRRVLPESYRELPSTPPLRLRVRSPSGGALECSLHGSLAEQVRHLLQAPPISGDDGTAVDEALAGVEHGRDCLVRALAHPDATQRVLDSQNLIRDLWRVDGGLGPYPPLEVLTSFQVGQANYPAYRDHLLHQVRVWVFGLYLLCRMPRLLDALADEVCLEVVWVTAPLKEVRAEVLRRWKVAALWHDLGYVFEFQSLGEPLQLIESSLAALNTAYYNPLAELLGEQLLPSREESQWQDASSVPVPAWRSLASFEALVAHRHQSLWQRLASAGWGAGLAAVAEPSGGFKPYFEICRTQDFVAAAGDRPGFIDHGIAGAILLLRLHGFMCDYGQAMAELLLATGLGTSDQRAAVASIAGRTQESAATVEAAARAIALHNLHPGLPHRASAVAMKLTPDRYRIRLREPGDCQPLAYLLALAVGLLGWDQPRLSRFMVPLDNGLIDQEVLLTAGARHIFLAFNTDEETAAAGFEGHQTGLGERLGGIRSLLMRGVAADRPPLLPQENEEPAVAAGDGASKGQPARFFSPSGAVPSVEELPLSFGHEAQRLQSHRLINRKNPTAIVVQGEEGSGHRYFLERLQLDLERAGNSLWRPVAALRLSLGGDPLITRAQLAAGIARAFDLPDDGRLDQLEDRIVAAILNRTEERVLVIDMVEPLTFHNRTLAAAFKSLITESWLELMLRATAERRTLPVFLLTAVAYPRPLPAEHPKAELAREMRAITEETLAGLRKSPRFDGRIRVEILSKLEPFDESYVADFLEETLNFDSQRATAVAENLVGISDNETILKRLRTFLTDLGAS